MASRSAPDHSEPPPSRPPSDAEASRGISDFFSRRTPQFTPTPPPSLPVSPSSSPLNRTKTLKGRSKRTRGASGLGGAPEGRDRHVQVDLEAGKLPERYDLGPRSPILPKVKLAFPSTMSDEEDWSPLVGGSATPLPGGSMREGGARRTWSQTTTTTRKTEHRSRRYSVPTSDQLYDEQPGLSPPPLAAPPPSPTPASSTPRNNNGATYNNNTPRQSFPSSRSLPSSVPFRTCSPSSASSPRKPPNSTSTRNTRTSLPSRRPPSFHASDYRPSL